MSDDAARAKLHDPVHPRRKLQVVGGDQRREAGCRAPAPSAPRTPGPTCRGPGCRSARPPASSFGRIGQRPAEGDALLFAPRQRRRAVAGPRAARRRWSRRSAARASAAAVGDAVGQLRQHDVLQRRKLGQQVVELVDEAHFGAPRLGPGAVRQAASSRVPRRRTRPGIRRVEQPRDVQQRRLTRPRRRHQRHHLARRDRQVDARAAPAPRPALPRL